MSLKSKLIGAAIKATAGKEMYAMWQKLEGARTKIGVAIYAIGEFLEAVQPQLEPLLGALGVDAKITAAVVKYVGLGIAAAGGISAGITKIFGKSEA